MTSTVEERGQGFILQVGGNEIGLPTPDRVDVVMAGSESTIIEEVVVVMSTGQIPVITTALVNHKEEGEGGASQERETLITSCRRLGEERKMLIR